MLFNHLTVYCKSQIWYKHCRFHKCPIALILTFPYVFMHNAQHERM